jgi:hypothetical protein
VDDTSIIIAILNPINFKNSVNVFKDVNRWFTTNLLSLNVDKTQFMQFITKISWNKKIVNICNTTFLGLTLNNTFSWKTRIDTVIPKLCFAIRAVKPFLSQESLKMVYYSCFHSIMTYGLIFWGNSCYSNINFRPQKRIIGIMVRIRDRDSCREYYRELKILPLEFQYIYSLSLFVISNKHYF